MDEKKILGQTRALGDTEKAIPDERAVALNPEYTFESPGKL